MSDNFIAVCELDNEVEAQLISAILEEADIAYMIRESDGTALPVYDLTGGYATLLAAEENREELLHMVEALREADFDIEADNDAEDFD